MAKDTINKASLLEENMKKALTEFLVLHLLSQRSYYIGELTDAMEERSGGVLNVVFPYAAIYRMLQKQYIEELDKCVAPDGRRRQYYAITESGRAHLESMTRDYARFTEGVNKILAWEEPTE